MIEQGDDDRTGGREQSSKTIDSSSEKCQLNGWNSCLGQSSSLLCAMGQSSSLLCAVLSSRTHRLPFSTHEAIFWYHYKVKTNRQINRYTYHDLGVRWTASYCCYQGRGEGRRGGCYLMYVRILLYISQRFNCDTSPLWKMQMDRPCSNTIRSWNAPTTL